MSMDYEEYYDKIYRYCYARLHHRQAAEDITQETFLRFLENPAYADGAKPLACLYTIARSRCINYLRTRREYPADDIADSPAFLTDMLEERLTSSLTLLQALKELTPQERELIFLRYVNEVSAADIGKILGLSRFTVHRRLNQCLKNLNAHLRKEEFF